MKSQVASASVIGVTGHIVDVEAYVRGQVRRFSLTGLPDSVVREARDRVRCAISSSGLSFPRHEVVVHLGPSSLPKVGANFDLAIALSVLLADRQLPGSSVEKTLFFAELTLDGRLRAARGVLSALEAAKQAGFSRCVVAPQQAQFARSVAILPVTSYETLSEAVECLRGLEVEKTLIFSGACSLTTQKTKTLRQATFADVVGNEEAKRAIEIAAAGGHNLLLIGPPGSGKSMLASRMSSILPPLTRKEALEVAKIESLASGETEGSLPVFRPFRAPHHTISAAGLLGGGSSPRPGEISQAHRGVLFLDELAEFQRSALEGLRQPLEEREVRIVRAKSTAVFPADFLLVAAMNPPDDIVPNASLGTRSGGIGRLAARISKPLLDRIDLQVWVPTIPVSDIHRSPACDPTMEMKQKVTNARKYQQARFNNTASLNAHMSLGVCRRHVHLGASAEGLLAKFAEKHEMTGRGYVRVLRISRTIADLDDCETVHERHLAEALAFRLL